MANRPMTQDEVESEIRRLVDLLETTVEQFEKLAVDAAEKKATYRAEWAKEYLKATGPVKQREAWTDYKMEDICFENEVAEALVKAKGQRISAIKTQLDALRTLAASARNL